MRIYPVITIPESLLDRDKLSRFECGSYAVIVKTPAIQKELRAVYGRSGLALKVLKGQTPEREIHAFNPGSRTEVSGEEHRYGAVTLKEASILQNLIARKGLAPRVYGLASVNGLIAQVVDYVPRIADPQDKEIQERAQNMLAIFEELGVKSVARDIDLGVNNWRSNKLVDFSHFKFKDFPMYLESLDIRTRTRRDIVLPKAYQPIPELGIPGSRDVDARIRNLGLESVPFKGATVLDVGCNFGTFCRYAADAGASRVIGIDKVGQMSFEVNNVLGYWNLDIVEAEILQYVSEKRAEFPRGFKFDIVFLMAVQNYIGGIESALNAIYPVAKKMLIIESHGGEDPATYDEAFAKFKFSNIEYMGYVEDPQRRHQWLCYK